MGKDRDNGRPWWKREREPKPVQIAGPVEFKAPALEAAILTLRAPLARIATALETGSDPAAQGRIDAAADALVSIRQQLIG